MLRITVDETKELFRLRLEGKLIGAWVAELERVYAARRAELDLRPLALDLDGLTGTDAAGRYLLALLRREGVVLENCDPLTVLPMSSLHDDRRNQEADR